MKLKVFGWDINVIRDSKLESMGEYSFREKQIKITTKIKGKEKDITILHELFHATCHRLGLDNANFSHDLEEIIADNFAVVITENADIKWKRHK